MGIYRAKTDSWYVERVVNLFAGTLILLGVILGFEVSKYFFCFTGFIGFMMIFYAFTGICPSSIVFHKLGIPSMLEKYCGEKD